MQYFCNLDELPALPAVAVKILEKIKDPETPMQQLADILATDPSLSAKVLTVVNSSYFSLPQRITNLSHAVNLLGEESLKYIALSFSLIKLFDRKTGKFDYTMFWQYSLTTALLSLIIARDLEWTDAEDMYFLGLIHNIGVMVLYVSHPRQYRLVIDRIKSRDMELYAAENEIFGSNHMEIGAYLLEQWELPEYFFLPVRFHHFPERIPEEDKNCRKKAELLRLSIEISRFMRNEDKTVHLAIIEGLLGDYGLEGRIDLAGVLEKVTSRLEPLLPLFDLDENNQVDYPKLLEESKKEMFRLSFSLTRKIRDQQETIENLSVLASRDGMTQLHNCQSFHRALDKEIAAVKRYGHSSVLAFADLDSFKAVNDNFGHMAGDHTLQTVSRFFLENIRKSDLVARYGGEEFVFILFNTDEENGYQVLDRLRKDLSRLNFAYQGKNIHVTMSLGLTSICRENTLSGDALLRQADAAMYRAKHAGKNQTVLYPPE
ncbi:MAG: HDOD domain-containing protein [Desulfosalsimonadaceae bacterium]